MKATVTESHRQVIKTRYLGPTDHRPSRISASCEAGRVVVSWDHNLNTSGNHAAAVRALLDKVGWGGEWSLGLDGPGAVAVFVRD